MIGVQLWHGQLLQLATKLDNIGARQHLVHHNTYAQIVQAYPRIAWGGCFHDAMKEEMELKPWSHTTAIPECVLASFLLALMY
jgi:cyanamide hydratase